MIENILFFPICQSTAACGYATILTIMVTEADIEKLALLARVALSSEEKEKLQKDVGAILEYISDIRKVSGGEERTKPSLINVMREDTVPHEGGIFSEELLSAAPSREGQYLKVKKIL